MLRWGASGKNHFLFDGESDRYVASICHSFADGYFVRFRGQSMGKVNSVAEGRSLIDAELKKEVEVLQSYLGGISV
jgi:hypothetical protein